MVLAEEAAHKVAHAGTPAASGRGIELDLAIIMPNRPLVYYAARCSGGTAIHAILRDLLVLHGVRLFAAPHLGYSAELIQSRHGNHWKVQGTVLGFARAHPPRSLGYVNGRCANGTDSGAEAYLREFS